MRAAVFIFLAFVAQIESRCVVDKCETHDDCSSCATFSTSAQNSHHIFSGVSYHCEKSAFEAVLGALLTNETYEAPRYGQCEVSVSDYIEYAKLVNKCEDDRNAKCCDPRGTKSAQMRQCSSKSCRVPTGCTIDGVCIYDTETAKAGNTVGCCSQDSDCPPYDRPNFWDSRDISAIDRICTRPHCERNTHTCVYERAKECCVADTPDCDAFASADAKCTIGACVYDAALSTALRMNPFTEQGDELYANVMHRVLQNDAETLRRTYGASVAPLRCESRIEQNCACSSDADCTPMSSRCAKVRCSSGTCVAEAREVPTDGVGACCSSSDTFANECSDVSDPCLVPVSCDASGTVLHAHTESDAKQNTIPHGAALLPSFECRYIRRTLTGDCCASKSDCEAMAAKNQCILGSCEGSGHGRQCALNPRGIDFMGGAHKLPCCHTDADCYAGDVDSLLRAVAVDAGSCAALECAGASDEVEIAQRHTCIPRMYSPCPALEQSMRFPSVIGATDACEKCGMPIVVRISAPVQVRRDAHTSKLVHFDTEYPQQIVVNLAFDGAGVVHVHDWFSSIMVVTLIDKNNPTNIMPKATPLLYKDARSDNGRGLYKLTYTNFPVFRARSFDFRVTLYINSTSAAKFPKLSQGLHASSNVSITWADESYSVAKLVASYAETMQKLGCSKDVVRPAKRSVEQRGDDVDLILSPFSVAPTFAPSLAPTSAPTYMPTPQPTFNVNHYTGPSCGENELGFDRHCDAFSGACYNSGMTGICVDMVNHPGKCSNTPPFNQLNVIPIEYRRFKLLETPDIVSNFSFCYATAGACQPAFPGGPHIPGTPCNCSCGCMKTASNGVDYATECLDGPYQDPNATSAPTPQPTPQPIPDSVTFAPTLPPRTDPNVTQCGELSIPSPCAPSATCETRNSTCNITLSACVGGCAPFFVVDSCTTDADCTFRDCCGCYDGSSYSACVVTPLSMTPAPSAAPPTLPPPTFGPPTPPPTLPTPAPTPPLPPSPPPTPPPPNSGQAAANGKGCKVGAKPWSGPVFPPYNDTLANTTVTLQPASPATCLGSSLDFVGETCRDTCQEFVPNNRHFSVPYEVVVRNFDLYRNLPEGELRLARDGFLVHVEATSCGPAQKCFSIVGVNTSIAVDPYATYERDFAGRNLPHFSEHTGHGSHVSVLFRATYLPKSDTAGVPTEFRFTVRIEGCAATVSKDDTSVSQCINVKARIVTGRCEQLIERWLRCAKNQYPAPNTTNQYMHDYRKCIDFVEDVHVAGNGSLAPFYVCPTPPPYVMSTTLNTRLSNVVIGPQAANYSTAAGGIVVDIEPSVTHMSQSEVGSCVTDPDTGLDDEFSRRFKCAVDDSDAHFNAISKRVVRCDELDTLVTVARAEIRLYNEPGVSPVTASGVLHTALAVANPTSPVCRRTVSLYRMVIPSGASAEVLGHPRAHSDDSNSAIISFSDIAPGDTLTVYVYTLYCNPTDKNTIITLTAAIDSTDGVLQSYGNFTCGSNARCRQKAVFKSLTPAHVSNLTFTCAEITSDSVDCETATSACSYDPIYIGSLGAPITVGLFVGGLFAICACIVFCVCVCKKSRRVVPGSVVQDPVYGAPGPSYVYGYNVQPSPTYEDLPVSEPPSGTVYDNLPVRIPRQQANVYDRPPAMTTKARVNLVRRFMEK